MRLGKEVLMNETTANSSRVRRGGIRTTLKDSWRSDISDKRYPLQCLIEQTRFTQVLTEHEICLDDIKRRTDCTFL